MMQVFLEWFNSPQQPTYWLYLVSTFLIAVLVYVVRDHRISGSSTGIFKYCFPARVYWHRSFLHDLFIYAINLLLFAFVLTYISITAEKLGSAVYSGLISHWGAVKSPVSGVTASTVYMLLVMLAVDLGFFISHYLHHKVPLLWEFHKVHHTAPVLNPLTAFRRHPLDYFIESNIIAVLLGLVYGTVAWLSGDKLEMLSILGVNAGIFLFLMIGSHLQHSHIWISYGPLNKIFVSPAMHHIHHSSADIHRDKNMGSMFSFWDYLMGTRYIPQRQEQLTLGLPPGEQNAMPNLVSLYWQPFVRVLGRLKRILPTRKN